jgi:4-hydroxy-tetrahydrodipicolinate reductase
MVRVAINGAAGRMGRRLVALAMEHDQLQLAGAVEAPGSGAIGQDAGDLAGAGTAGVTVSDSLPEAVDLVIDFSAPVGLRRVLETCRSRGLPAVIGTTGLTSDDEALMEQASADIALLQATNFSLVVNVLNHLAAQAAKLLGEDYDIEVLEAHHRFKKDAPSGTARTLARVLCEATGRSFERDVLFARHGEEAARQRREITVQTLRIGDHPGEHTAYFATLGERLELRHVSTSRDSYAVGALRAGLWLAKKPAGRYHMTDVLGL